MNPKEDSSVRNPQGDSNLIAKERIKPLLQAKSGSCRVLYAHIVSRPGIQAAFVWTCEWGIPLPFTGEFEAVIMIAVVTEEMHGSD
jgi:hypothetical protein